MESNLNRQKIFCMKLIIFRIIPIYTPKNPVVPPLTISFSKLINRLTKINYYL